MKMKSNPFVEMDLGFAPGSTPDTDMSYVVYRGHEPKFGTLAGVFGGYKYVNDTDAAKKKDYPVELICAFTDEADAQRKVDQLNSTLGEDDVQYKYHGEILVSCNFGGMNIDDVSTLGIIMNKGDKYSVNEVCPVYSYLSEEQIIARMSEYEVYADRVVFVELDENRHNRMHGFPNPNTLS